MRLPLKIEIVEIIVNDKGHIVRYKIESEEDILNELEVIFQTLKKLLTIEIYMIKLCMFKKPLSNINYIHIMVSQEDIYK